VSPITIAVCATVVSFTIAPREDVARESVDLIELNHFYDEHGRLVFDQVIFYDWSSADARYNVRAWRLVKNPAQLPQRDWSRPAASTGSYSAMWQDGEQLRHVQSQSFRETWTQYDPELVEREYLPKERRKELRTVRALRQATSRVASDAPRPPEPPRDSLGSSTVAIGR
jgi:hypothetical protein